MNTLPSTTYAKALQQERRGRGAYMYGKGTMWAQHVHCAAWCGRMPHR